VLLVFALSALPYLLLAISPVLRLAAESGGGTLGRSTPPPSIARMRRALVALQVSVAVVLLAQGALLVRSSRNMLRAELGFDESNLLKAYILLPRTQYPDPGSRRLAMAQLVERIRQVPEVMDAAVGHPHPFRGAPATPYECEGCTPGGTQPRAVEAVVTSGYFNTLRIPLRAGRLFDDRDRDTLDRVAIVSEALSRRLWNTADGTGRRLRRAGDEPGAWLTVVGVVGEVRKSYTDSLYPDVYLPFEQLPRAFGTVMVRTRTEPLALEPRIREAAASADPTLALAEVEPMAVMLRDRRGPARVLAGFVGGVAVLGFGLTVLGLAAVVGYLVRLRRREFAVRLTLGARPMQIVRRVFRDAGGMLGVGLLLGVGLAWGLAGASRAVLAGISPRDPLTYGGVVLLVVGVAMAALLVPAFKAAVTDPSISLREE
jgi:putative ABC transport system permease protein